MRELSCSEIYELEACLRELAEHHNMVSENFAGAYPKRPYRETLQSFEAASAAGSETAKRKNGIRTAGAARSRRAFRRACGPAASARRKKRETTSTKTCGLMIKCTRSRTESQPGEIRICRARGGREAPPRRVRSPEYLLRSFLERIKR